MTITARDQAKAAVKFIAAMENYLRAYDIGTGRELWKGGPAPRRSSTVVIADE